MRGNAEQVCVYERAAGENVNVPLHCVCVHFVPLSVWRLTSYQSSARAVLGNICPRLWQYGAKKARSALKQPSGTFLNTARASEVDWWVVYYMALGWNLFILNLPAFANKNTRLWFFPWKQSVWQNPDQVKTTRNVRTDPRTTLPCDKN